MLFLSLKMSNYQTNDISNWKIAIIHSKDGQEWVTYLSQCLKNAIKAKSRLSSPPLTITHHKVNEINFEHLLSKDINNFSLVKTFVIILTPSFLNYIDSHPQVYNLGRILAPDKTVSVLCGISLDNISNCHKAALVSFESWPCLTAKDQDYQSAIAIIETICGILFSKILTHDLNTALPSNDNINDTKVEAFRTYEQTTGPVNPQFKLFPRKVNEGNEKVHLILNKPLKIKLDVPKVFLEINGKRGAKELKEVNVKIKNPFVLQILIPEKFFQVTRIINVILLLDNKERHLLGSRPLKCESKMNQLYFLLSSINDPLEFLKQTFGSSTIDDLDKELTDRFDRNCPNSGFNIFENGFNSKVDCFQYSEELESSFKMPSLLHFSANYGLKHLTSKLLVCPDAIIACFLKNSNGLNSLDLAIKNKHNDVAQILQQFIDSSNSNSFSSFKINLLYHQSDAIKAAIIKEDKKKETNSIDESLEMVHCKNNIDKELDQSLSLPSSMFNFDQNANLKLESESKLTLENLKKQDIKSLIKNFKIIKESNLTSSQIELIKILQLFETNCFSFQEIKQLLEQWSRKYNSSSFFDESKFDLSSFLNNLNNFHNLYKKTSSIKTRNQNFESYLSTSNLVPIVKNRSNLGINESLPFIQPRLKKENTTLTNSFVYHDYVNESQRKLNTFENQSNRQASAKSGNHNSKTSLENELKNFDTESYENGSEYHFYKIPSKLLNKSNQMDIKKP